jgi:hypothetical protein
MCKSIFCINKISNYNHMVFVFHNLTNNFRGLLFDHMAHDHGFNVGLPDNLGKYFFFLTHMLFLMFQTHYVKKKNYSITTK